MVKIVEQEEEEADQLEASPYSITPSSFPTTPSSHNPNNNNHNYHPSPPPSQPASPSSSDQTFHGFSPKPSPPSSPPPSASLTRLVRDDPPPTLTMTEPGPVSGFAYEGGGGADQSVPSKVKRKGKVSSSISRRGGMTRGAAIALRVFEFVVCLISFSVMAADKNRGWALDSFDRYKEFRYCITVNVIGFAYSGIQGSSLAYQLTTGKQMKWGQMRCCFDFLVDQILAYLLVSASSSAATRVDDWISNWGQDKFPAMASASVAMSFLAFVAFALSSLISGYILCT